MDTIKDAYVIRLVERISEHYRANISNRFIRPALLQLALDNETWGQIEDLTEKYERFRYQGFHLDELYRQVAAAARFVYITRRELAPTLRHRLTNAESTGADRVLRNMAINNFAFNLKVLGEMLYDLYLKLVELDEVASKGRKPLHQQIPELSDISGQLIGA